MPNHNFSLWRFGRMPSSFALAWALSIVPSSAWDAGPTQCKHDECIDGIHSAYGSRWSGNTHLWLVNQAIKQLSTLNLPAATYIANRLNEPTCRTNWELGLWDTDDKWVDYDNYPGSHFYNPRNVWWDGSYTKAKTYLVLGTDQGWYWENAEAKSQAASRILAAGGLLTDNQCYQLGRALHYLTDMTQPMHVTSFSGLTVPTQLHPVWEMYVVPLAKGLTPAAFGGRFQSNMPCAVPTNCTSDEIFEMTAWRTSDTWRYDIMNILLAGEGCTYTLLGYNTTGACFRAYTPSDTLARQILADAVPSVTAYLYSLRNNIAVVRQTATCGNVTWGISNAKGPGTSSYRLMKLVGSSWTDQNVAANYLAVGGPNCEVWSADSSGTVTGPTGGVTVLAKAKGLAVGANGDVWMIDQADVPAKLDRSNMQFYEPANPAISRSAVSRIAVSPTGVLHATVNNIIVKLGSNNQWINLAGVPTGREISFSSDGTLWAIGTAVQDRDKGWSTVPESDNQGPFDPNYNIQSMNGAGSWTIVPGSAVNIDAGGTAPIVLTRQGVVWTRSGSTWSATSAKIQGWT